MITNLSSLRLALADYINRSDIASATLDLFIDNGRREGARYQAREQEQFATLTLDADLRAPLPARYMAARAVYTVAGIVLPQIGSVFASVGSEGGYRVVGEELEAFGGGLEEGDELELHYYEFPSQLVADSDTNTFLTVNADLWLWCAVLEAGRYLRNEELTEAAVRAVETIGGRVSATANAGRQYGGPRQMKLRGQ